MNHFTDQMHINRIRDALWQGREYVRAAVMVGAGFSLNAKPKSAAAASFPGWSELAAGLVAELYPKDASSDARREEALRQAGTSSGALRLAQEYKAAFGRDALDSFLRRKISDHLAWSASQ